MFWLNPVYSKLLLNFVFALHNNTVHFLSCLHLALLFIKLLYYNYKTETASDVNTSTNGLTIAAGFLLWKIHISYLLYTYVFQKKNCQRFLDCVSIIFNYSNFI